MCDTGKVEQKTQTINGLNKHQNENDKVQTRRSQRNSQMTEKRKEMEEDRCKKREGKNSKEDRLNKEHGRKESEKGMTKCSVQKGLYKKECSQIKDTDNGEEALHLSKAG